MTWISDTQKHEHLLHLFGSCKGIVYLAQIDDQFLKFGYTTHPLQTRVHAHRRSFKTFYLVAVFHNLRFPRTVESELASWVSHQKANTTYIDTVNHKHTEIIDINKVYFIDLVSHLITLTGIEPNYIKHITPDELNYLNCYYDFNAQGYTAISDLKDGCVQLQIKLSWPLFRKELEAFQCQICLQPVGPHCNAMENPIRFLPGNWLTATTHKLCKK